MRIAIITLLAMILGAGGVLAQAGAPNPATPNRSGQPAKTLPGREVPTDTMAECMRLWDSATHMTRQEWARTCRRIQSRLESLRIENLKLDAGTPKAARNSQKGG
jgi:hypothetical protein